MWKPCVFFLLILALASLTVGCSSFGGEWKRASQMPAGPDGIAGRWDGRWVSGEDDHGGRLQAVVLPITNHQYQVRYRATYAGFLRFGYGMMMEVTPTEPGACSFAAEAGLGVWGRYSCEGEADGTNFTARYRTRYDRGSFELHRVDSP